MSTAANMKAAMRRYLDAVEGTLQELSELEELAETHSTVINSNDEIHLKIEDAVREIGHLQGQREELYQDYFNASFEGVSERISGIESDRDQIDARLDELHQTIEDSRAKIIEIDGDAVARLLAHLDALEVPTFCSGSIDWGRMPAARGTYRMIPRTGLVGELAKAHDALVTEIAGKQRYIRELQPWWKYAARELATV